MSMDILCLQAIVILSCEYLCLSISVFVYQIWQFKLQREGLSLVSP